MLKFKKPSGVIVNVNDEPGSIIAAMKLGWEQLKAPVKKVTPKKAPAKK